ncbi:MAG: copper resistance protein CopC, partial [Candidatus Acidiferrum sp.]
MPIWWGRPHEQPEVVLEQEVAIGADGIVKIDIDTLPAKELHGNQDHQYAITAEVTDESRRTIVGTGNVLVSRKPFTVFAWVTRGYFRAGDDIQASFHAQTLDQKPVQGKGELNLLKITYNDKNEPVEKSVQTWQVDTDAQGSAQQQMKAAEPGQFRLAYKVTDSKGHTVEGGYVFTVRGDGFDGRSFRFNDLELITDKREYAPGEKIRLQINTNKADAAVLLFVRPTNGICLPPKLIRMNGKSAVEEIAVVQKDMPNFFIEALTIADARVHSEMREVIVPPEKRVINVEVLASKPEYKPGEKATMKVKLTDLLGKPFIGSTVLTIYDKSVEYIAGGSNVPEIKEFFWKWRRSHHPQTETSLGQWFG